MCTVTFIPIKGQGNFIFTSNRDEFPQRTADELMIKTINEKKVLFPQDQRAKGTWIAISDSDQLVCILNGAFEAHKRRDDYVKSRGIMALEMFEYENSINFLKNYNLKGIEPFTMILYDCGNLFELKWDYNIKHIRNLNPEDSHIWASSTLYSEKWQKKRQKWFSEWHQKHVTITQSAVLDFHNNAGEGNDRYDVKMYVDGLVQTTSITSIEHDKDSMRMRFESISNGDVKQEKIQVHTT
ncbi:MAG: NRDE family protein [Saprospiraceae bacterium]